MRVYTAAEILEAREERVILIHRLIKKHNLPLLVMRVNYPGLQKTNELTVEIIQDMGLMLGSLWGDRVKFKSWQLSAEGPAFWLVVQGDAAVLKRAAIDLEERHLLGRCLDIDVYDCLGQSLSRQEFGYPRRKCYLCENDAQNCVRSRHHSEAEVIKFIEARFREYKEQTVGRRGWQYQ